MVRIAGGVGGTKAGPATSGLGEAVTAPSKIEFGDGDVWYCVVLGGAVAATDGFVPPPESLPVVAGG